MLQGFPESSERRGKDCHLPSRNNPRIEKGEAVLKAGGVGMILVNDEGSDMVADSHVIPATMISYKDGFALDSYMNSTRINIMKRAENAMLFQITGGHNFASKN
ncbi:hypothetical protein HPP92_000009 [Vanilla planifolia]|uniref:PA domain-containing protein n=1 Tax=Vanilla planifolia TaxID=51239 RepID=A0A835S0H0_VANPL|nr:hypothetical protein HPP92_000009 [Vanilla planifolia]